MPHSLHSARGGLSVVGLAASTGGSRRCSIVLPDGVLRGAVQRRRISPPTAQHSASLTMQQLARASNNTLLW